MSTTRRPGSGSYLKWLVAPAALLAVLGGSASRADAVALTMEATKTDAGVRLCVGVDSQGQRVAGTQNDLVWDAACARLKPETCTAIPDAKKPLHGNVPRAEEPRYRALVFALDNVDPMRDGPLYCCDFELQGSGDGCCAVRFDRIGVSDPSGNALDTSTNPPQLCLATLAAPEGGVDLPTPAPAAPVQEAAGGTWVWIVVIGIAVVVVAILLLRGRSQ